MMDTKTTLLVNRRPQSSLVSRFTAGAFGDHNITHANLARRHECPDYIVLGLLIACMLGAAAALV
jgi:hypothetical protein